MESKKLNSLFTVIGIILGIAGLAFILVSVLNENASRWMLTAGLAFIALGTLLNLFLYSRQKKSR